MCACRVPNCLLPIMYLGLKLEFYPILRVIGEGLSYIEPDHCKKSLSERNGHLGCDQNHAGNFRLLLAGYLILSIFAIAFAIAFVFLIADMFFGPLWQRLWLEISLPLWLLP